MRVIYACRHARNAYKPSRCTHVWSVDYPEFDDTERNARYRHFRLGPDGKNITPAASGTTPGARSAGRRTPNTKRSREPIRTPTNATTAAFMRADRTARAHAAESTMGAATSYARPSRTLPRRLATCSRSRRRESRKRSTLTACSATSRARMTRHERRGDQTGRASRIVQIAAKTFIKPGLPPESFMDTRK